MIPWLTTGVAAITFDAYMLHAPLPLLIGVGAMSVTYILDRFLRAIEQ